MSLLLPSISSSVLKSPSLHPSVPSTHPESRTSLYCGRVSKVPDKPMLNPYFNFYSFVAFLLLLQSLVQRITSNQDSKPSQAPLSLCHPFLPHSFLYSPRIPQERHSTDLTNDERTRVAPWVQFSNTGTHKVLMTFCCVSMQ